MPPTKSRKTALVRLPQSELETLLEQAACRGARKALMEVGLADEAAASDLRTIRGLASSLKLMQRTFLQTLVRWLTIGLLVLLLAGIATKSNFLQR